MSFGSLSDWLVFFSIFPGANCSGHSLWCTEFVRGLFKWPCEVLGQCECVLSYLTLTFLSLYQDNEGPLTLNRAIMENLVMVTNKVRRRQALVDLKIYVFAQVCWAQTLFTVVQCDETNHASPAWWPHMIYNRKGELPKPDGRQPSLFRYSDSCENNCLLQMWWNWPILLLC